MGRCGCAVKEHPHNWGLGVESSGNCTLQEKEPRLLRSMIPQPTAATETGDVFELCVSLYSPLETATLERRINWNK